MRDFRSVGRERLPVVQLLCHPERSEGSPPSEQRARGSRSFAALRMTRRDRSAAGGVTSPAAVSQAGWGTVAESGYAACKLCGE